MESGAVAMGNILEVPQKVKQTGCMGQAKEHLRSIHHTICSISRTIKKSKIELSFDPAVLLLDSKSMCLHKNLQTNLDVLFFFKPIL
jgi:hypothetical protein